MYFLSFISATNLYECLLALGLAIFMENICIQPILMVTTTSYVLVIIIFHAYICLHLPSCLNIRFKKLWNFWNSTVNELSELVQFFFLPLILLIKHMMPFMLSIFRKEFFLCFLEMVLTWIF